MSAIPPVTFENLPEIGEEHLKREDLLTMASWVTRRGAYLKRLKQQTREAGDDLDGLWREDPAQLIGSVDRPNPSKFMAANITDTVGRFGLLTAQLAAYNSMYKGTVEGLNDDLRSHFLLHGVAMTAHGDPDIPRRLSLGIGAYELSHDGHAWGRRLGTVSGEVIDVNLSQGAVFRLRAGEEEEYGVRLAPLGSNGQINPAECLDIELHYPEPEAA